MTRLVFQISFSSSRHASSSRSSGAFTLILCQAMWAAVTDLLGGCQAYVSAHPYTTLLFSVIALLCYVWNFWRSWCEPEYGLCAFDPSNCQPPNVCIPGFAAKLSYGYRDVRPLGFAEAFQTVACRQYGSFRTTHVLRLKGPVTPDRVRRSLWALMARFPTLRMGVHQVPVLSAAAFLSSCNFRPTSSGVQSAESERPILVP
jgi:hypothetical protein